MLSETTRETSVTARSLDLLQACGQVRDLGGEMFELAQDSRKVDTCISFAAFGGTLRITGVASPSRGHDEPLFAEDRKGSLHSHSRDLEPRGQVTHGAHVASGLDVPAQDLLTQDVGRLLRLRPGVVFRDFSAHHAVERTQP